MNAVAEESWDVAVGRFSGSVTFDEDVEVDEIVMKLASAKIQDALGPPN
jgi:hypothetical protein